MHFDDMMELTKDPHFIHSRNHDEINNACARAAAGFGVEVAGVWQAPDSEWELRRVRYVRGAAFGEPRLIAAFSDNTEGEIAFATWDKPVRGRPRGFPHYHDDGTLMPEPSLYLLALSQAGHFAQKAGSNA